MKDELGDRMKAYEGAQAKLRLDPELPMIARLDGRGFSKFTRGFVKPFDDTLTRAMDQATKALVDETHANIGYTQSDEITLIWDAVKRSNFKRATMTVFKCASPTSIVGSGTCLTMARQPTHCCGVHRTHAVMASPYSANNTPRIGSCRGRISVRCLRSPTATVPRTSMRPARQASCLDVTSNGSRVSVNCRRTYA